MTHSRQLRRHARQMRRYGMQPMIVINAGDGLPEVAVVMLARWAWRYRSELAPLALAIATMLAATILHLTHPGAWPAVLAATVVTGSIVLVFGRLAGLASLAERVYFAWVVAADGGWLTAATALGPLHPPLPLALAIGGLVIAVPWWAHRRRRAKVRVERKLAAWPEISHAVGLAGSEVMSAVVDLWGWRARFRLARGQTIDDVRAKLPAIESGLGTFRGAARVYPTPDDLANRFELRVLDADPHADAVAWPGPSVSSITEPIDLGPFEDATPVTVLFLRRHGLVGGNTGSGKSGGLNVLMGNLTACTDVVIWAVDLKRGMELGPWRSCIGRLATTPAEARALLASAVAVLEARAEQLAAAGQRTWEPSPRMPALLILIDEYAELAESAPDAVSYCDSIARLGRAVAVTLVAATQRPTQKAMGQGALRSQMDVRISFRVRERRDVDLILGQGMLAAGWHAHTLNAPGKFLISAPEYDTPRRARAYLLTDDAVHEAAAAHASLRPVLDPVSAAAADAPRPTGRAGGQGGTIGAPDGVGRPQAADPEALLWDALRTAPADGVAVSDLMRATGMGRSWVYYRLAGLSAAGRAVQTIRGCWSGVPQAGNDA